MEKVDTLIVDKTGTLTEGRPAVTEIVPAEGFTRDEVLKLAASVERASEHPLAQAIVRAAEERNVGTVPVAGFDSPTGKGAFGTVEGRRVVLGNKTFLKEEHVDVASLEAQAEMLRQDGATAIFVGVDGRPVAIVAIADPVKPTTPEALAALKSEGVRVVMLTGDNWTTARAVARRLGIDEVEAEVLPEQKSAVRAKAQDRGSRNPRWPGTVSNDAPALAAAIEELHGNWNGCRMGVRGSRCSRRPHWHRAARRLSQEQWQHRQNLSSGHYNALGFGCTRCLPASGVWLAILRRAGLTRRDIKGPLKTG